jgi:hypothetical protein
VEIRLREIQREKQLEQKTRLVKQLSEAQIREVQTKRANVKQKQQQDLEEEQRILKWREA